MLLSGTELAKNIMSDLQARLAKSPRKRAAKLIVLMVGENPSSLIYIKKKQQACEKIGIESETLSLPKTARYEEVAEQINSLNQDPSVDAILLQLPLPSHLPYLPLLSLIDPKKDVDGFHPINMGKLLIGDNSGFIPCTALGIQKLLLHYQIPIEKKHVVILGRSNIVGKPLAALLMQKNSQANATITLCHSNTERLDQFTKQADILIAAMGQREMVRANMIKKDAVVIDVGMNRNEDGKVVGDVLFEEVKNKAAAITPVPGGIGPMTVAMLLHNTVISFQQPLPKGKRD